MQRELGTLYAGFRRPDQAHTGLSAAIELHCAIDIPFSLSHAEVMLTKVEG